MGAWGTVASTVGSALLENSQSQANSASNAAMTGLGENKPMQQLRPQSTPMVNYMDYLKSRGGY